MLGLEYAAYNLEWVGKVLQRKVPAQLAGGYGVIGHALKVSHKAFFYSLGGAYVVYLVALRPEPWQQRQIGCDVAGSSAAR